MIQLAEFEPLVGVQERVVKTLYLLIKCPLAFDVYEKCLKTIWKIREKRASNA